MSPTHETAMEQKVPGTQSVWYGITQGLRALGLGLVLALVLSGTAFAQAGTVTGTVTAAGGGPLQGVTVRVVGSELRTFTRSDGKYSIAAPPTGTLTFTLIGQRPITTPVGGRTTVDVRMEAVAFLEEVVVTAYAEQRRADITGAVASINIESAQRQTSASVLKKLETVPGITVATSGSPGSRSTVRIRGISSFQNNDPLYVIDGVPVQDSYINWLNPNDITSIQVLKDASSASIYGSRASNGVIVIETTKRGVSGPPRMTASVRTGMSTPTRGYDDFLITNSLDYFQVMKATYENAGLAVPTNIYGDPKNPSIPQYTFAAPGTRTGFDAFGRPTGVDVTKYSYPNNLIHAGSTGTNWWKEVFGTGKVGDYNLSVSGAGDDNAYGVSMNYFDETGTAIHNRFRRGSVRANTSFTRGKFSFGENVALAHERSVGGIDDGALGENNIIGKNILSQPVVPVYDIAGNFASGKGVTLGNNTNPVKIAFEQRNNLNRFNKAFGNVFGGYAITPKLSVRSSLGFNLSQASNSGYNAITPENSEPNFTNSIFDNQNNSTDWTLSNTARFSHTISQHNFNVLAGQEAAAGTSRFINGSLSNLLNTGVESRYVQDALGDAKSKQVNSGGGRSALLSYLGKLDYTYGDKYVASFTVRRDGSSRLGPDYRWGTFPAVGLGWRVTKEPFLEGNKFLTDAMIRVGYGVTGNQSIPAGRISSQFGGNVNDVYYDITGSNTSAQAGFRQTSLGNPELRWEENKSINVGTDLQLFEGKLNVVLDLYRRSTDNLLFNPAIPATAGVASAPIVNIGEMRNTGADFSIGHQGATWNATLQGTTYKNEIVRIDGTQKEFFGPIATRFGNQVINRVGQPIGAFYGRKSLGFFKDAADVAAHAKQDGAAPGRLKFADLNGDGTVTIADRTIIGSPHPDFTLGLDLGLRRGNWDLSGTVFGTFGNEIFDVQKEFYVFQNFSTTVRKDLLTDSWTPTNQNAKYPKLDRGDTYSKELSDFYVEDGSHVRMRNIQLGYAIPQRYATWLSASRIYLQAENLFTITGYSGLDPSLPAANANGSAGDIRDQYRGVDRGVYPTSKVFSIGLTTSF